MKVLSLVSIRFSTEIKRLKSLGSSESDDESLTQLRNFN